MHLNTSIKTFNRYKDLDQNFWINRAKAEARDIFNKKGPRRGRSLETIEKTTKYGHAPECLLIKEYGFTDDIRKFKDLFDKEGREVEIKVRANKEAVEQCLIECAQIKNEKSQFPPHKKNWRNFPDIIYMFIGNFKTGDYYLENVYKWDGHKFIKYVNNKNEKK